MGIDVVASSNSREAVWTALWYIRDPKDGNPSALHILDVEPTLQVNQPIEVDPRAIRLVLLRPSPSIEPRVVVPGHDDLDRMRLRLEPVELDLDVGGGARVCQVAGVYEDVAGGHVDDLVVGVGDADDADGGLVRRRVEGVAAQEEDGAVEADGDEGERGGEDVVEDGERLPLIAAAEAEPGEEAHC